MKCKGVIFDFNGTLFFDNDKHIKAWGAISQLIRGYGISDQELHEHFNGVPNKEIIQYLFNGECDDEMINKYSLLKEEYYRKYCQEDVESFHLVEIDFFVESFHLDNWINPKNIVYDDGTYKNKIAMFEKASEILNIELKECLIFEDSISGIKNAYRAGCPHIIVIDSANKKEEYQDLPGVIKVIDNFVELESL